MAMEADRLPPQAVDIERAVLSACLIDPHAANAVSDILTESDFYHGAHRKIYSAILEIVGQAGIPLDQISVTQTLMRRGHLDGIGGALSIAQLAIEVGTSANVEYHAGIVKEKALARQTINLLSQTQQDCYDPSRQPLEVLHGLQEKLFELERGTQKPKARPLEDVLHEVFDQIEIAHKKGGVPGISTGYRELDEMTAGLHPGEVTIVAGRTAMGKTAYSLALARHAAVKSKVPVLIYSLEMTADQIVRRLLCAEARVNSHRMRQGRLSDEDWMRLSSWTWRLTQSKLWIDDAAGLSILDIMGRSRRLKAEHDIGLIVVDYLQLISAPRERGDSQEIEIGKVMAGLRVLAKDLKIPVVVCAQLSRKTEDRGGDKRPALGDLRGSGNIENHADVVLFLYRPAYYGIKDDEGGDQEGLAEVIIGKQRNGTTGTVLLTWLEEYGRFEEPGLYQENPDYGRAS